MTLRAAIRWATRPTLAKIVYVIVCISPSLQFVSHYPSEPFLTPRLWALAFSVFGVFLFWLKWYSIAVFGCTLCELLGVIISIIIPFIFLLCTATVWVVFFHDIPNSRLFIHSFHFNSFQFIHSFIHSFIHPFHSIPFHSIPFHFIHSFVRSFKQICFLTEANKWACSVSVQNCKIKKLFHHANLMRGGRVPAGKLIATQSAEKQPNCGCRSRIGGSRPTQASSGPSPAKQTESAELERRVGPRGWDGGRDHSSSKCLFAAR